MRNDLGLSGVHYESTASLRKKKERKEALEGVERIAYAYKRPTRFQELQQRVSGAVGKVGEGAARFGEAAARASARQKEWQDKYGNPLGGDDMRRQADFLVGIPKGKKVRVKRPPDSPFGSFW